MAGRAIRTGVSGTGLVPVSGSTLPVPAAQEWWSARELAELAQARGVESWPHSEDAAKRRIKRDGWDGLGPRMARLRAATGGRPGMEYHVSLLPDALRAAIAGVAFRGVALAVQEQDAEADRRRMAALSTSSPEAVTRRTRSWMVRACSSGNSCAQRVLKSCSAAMASASET